MISKATIDRIRAAVDLRDLVGEFTRLNRQGLGLCMFHVEQSPSFRVFEDGHFFCFGCQLSGDCFTFLMRSQGITFLEAAQQLSERTGILLDDARPVDPKAERRAQEVAARAARMAAWYWREQRIIATRKRSGPMLDWINRLTPKEMLMIWIAERTTALETQFHEDEKLAADLCGVFAQFPTALDALVAAVSKLDS